MEKFKINHTYCQIPFWKLQRKGKSWHASGNSFSISQDLSINGGLEQDAFCCCLFKRNGRITNREIKHLAGVKTSASKITKAMRNLAQTKYHLINRDKNGEITSFVFSLFSIFREIGRTKSKVFEYEIDQTIEKITSGHQWISLEQYFSFKAGLPRRLFLFLEKKRNEFPDGLTIGIEKLCQWLPVNGRYLSDKKRTLKKALEELQTKSYSNYKFSNSKVDISWPAAFFNRPVKEENQAIIPYQASIEEEITSLETNPAKEPLVESATYTKPNTDSLENTALDTNSNLPAEGEITPAIETTVNTIHYTTPNLIKPEYIATYTAPDLEEKAAAREELPLGEDNCTIDLPINAAIQKQQELVTTSQPIAIKEFSDLNEYTCSDCNNMLGFLKNGLCPSCLSKKQKPVVDEEVAMQRERDILEKQIESAPKKYKNDKDNYDIDLRDTIKEKIENVSQEDLEEFDKHIAESMVNALINQAQNPQNRDKKAKLSHREKRELYFDPKHFPIWPSDKINDWLQENGYRITVGQLMGRCNFKTMRNLCVYFSTDFLRKTQTRKTKIKRIKLLVTIFADREEYEFSDEEDEMLEKGKHPFDKVLPPDPEVEYKQTQRYIKQVDNAEDEKKRRRQLFLDRLSEEKYRIDFDDLEQEARIIGKRRVPLPFKESVGVVARHTRIAMLELLAKRLGVDVPESDVYGEVVGMLKMDLQLAIVV